MTKTNNILRKIEEMEQFKLNREMLLAKANEDYNINDEIRHCTCPDCKKITEQRVDERLVIYPIGHPCNNSFTKISYSNVIGWWCNECDDEISIIEWGRQFQ